MTNSVMDKKKDEKFLWFLLPRLFLPVRSYGSMSGDSAAGPLLAAVKERLQEPAAEN